MLGRYHVDKLIHALLFAVQFLLLVRSFRMHPRSIGQREHAVWISIVITVLYGAITELLQHVSGGGRSGDPLDFLADAVGVFLATALLYWGAGTNTYLGKHLDRYF
jgi:VanZ family protein